MRYSVTFACGHRIELSARFLSTTVLRLVNHEVKEHRLQCCQCAGNTFAITNEPATMRISNLAGISHDVPRVVKCSICGCEIHVYRYREGYDTSDWKTFTCESCCYREMAANFAAKKNKENGDAIQEGQANQGAP